MRKQDTIHQDSQKDQRLWPLTLRNLSKKDANIRRRSDSGHWIDQSRIPDGHQIRVQTGGARRGGD
jgi:hypothetical protein